MKNIRFEKMKKGDIVEWRPNHSKEICQGKVNHIRKEKNVENYRMRMTAIGTWTGRTESFYWWNCNDFYLIKPAKKPIPTTFKAKNKTKITCQLLKKY